MMNESVKYLFIDKGVCITAAATPSLLTVYNICVSRKHKKATALSTNPKKWVSLDAKERVSEI